MAIKIYTKTGDKGKTSLIGGTKVLKSHWRINTYGTVDELNSHIGLLSDHIQFSECIEVLREVQDRLFTIGSSLACDPEKEPGFKIPDLRESDVVFLEEKIDEMNEVMPPMTSFVLPGGHVAVSQAHVARCVCRRAERTCVFLKEQGDFVDDLVIKYLNRLSDYLFVLSRYLSQKLGVAEIPWKPRV
ncbi:MAG: cob(I)yrinic acid a,c-diamide adenosyltransferase [Chitinophagaceae bacterium]|jgi:cob(I)alamin adenosyltransferase|nr:cob(I)yrinic acid a,c-diamide adenosyltransferase [Chitinophagaceae bacterium]MCU0404372.1 cob(I)yrinic acid a,c-diamide adenosyltransferase [Chitinophagaceae bacterium]